MNSYKNIDEIIDSYNTKIQGVIRRFIKTEDDVKDIEQEVYIKTWRNLSKYSGKASFWSWISKITVNTCKDHLRSNKACFVTNSDEVDIIQNIPDKTSRPDEKCVFSERHKLILDAIDKLNPKLREVIILSDIDDLTYEEISQKVKCPVGTVKSRLFNARKILKQELISILN